MMETLIILLILIIMLCKESHEKRKANDCELRALNAIRENGQDECC